MRKLLKKLTKLNIKINLVDEKLDIQAPKGVMTENLLNEIKLHKDDLIAFITLYKPKKEKHLFIPQVPEQSSYGLSSSQKRLWILSQFEGGNTAYNMPSVFELKGGLAISSLENAFQTLIERHESLRTVFKENKTGEVRQIILSPADIKFQLQYEDLSNEENTVEKIKSIIQKETTYAFDLSTGSLIRAKLVKTSQDTYIFICVIHHIISDGQSVEVMANELFTLYDSFAKGNGNTLPALQLQYKDYAAWQQNQLKNDGIENHKSYWLQQFDGEIPVLDLPTYQTRPIIKTYTGKSVNILYKSSLLKDFSNLCQSQGSTLFMGLLATLKLLLYRYTNQKDIVIGSPIAGREHADLQNQIGFYVNTLALRTRFDGEDSFKELLANVKEITLGAYEHQIYPYDELVQNLPIKRDISRNPLFDVMLTVQKDILNEKLQQFETIEIKEYQSAEEVLSKFDMDFSFVETKEGLRLTLTYNANIYSDEFTQKIVNHLGQLLEVVMAQPNTPINQLDYLSDKEKHQLLVEFNDTEVDYPKDKTIIDLFEEQVSKTPNNIAIVFEAKELTYKKLNEKSNRLAHYLRINYDVKPDDLVGIKLERSEWMIIAILGVLKSGGAYVPMDTEYPQERIDYMITDSQCKMVINEKELEKFEREENKYSQGNLISISKPNDLAYAIYTSGSTGKPKGVMIEHKNLVNYIFSQINYLRIGDGERIPLLTNISFDASVEQLFSTLLSSSTLYIFKKEHLQTPEILGREFTKNKITHIHSVPSLLKTIDLKEIGSIKRIISAGEVYNKEITKRYIVDCKIYNKYGPTETTISSVIGQIRNVEDSKIGTPISNTQVYILDEVNQPLPIGVTGKIFISGAGVARGYLNQPELTAEKFVANPFKEGERMYETGDIGRWLPDGNIEFIGRKDDQVKIRGYRIELGEIETALQKHKNIDGAVVVAQSNDQGEKELVAYIVSKEALNSTDIRTYLSSTLPAYMLPSYFVQLEELPLTPNGKIDKKALPDSEGLGLSSGVEYVAPRNETEEKLVQIWQEILGKEKISIKDNFFELGGHSLKATRLSSQIHKQFEVKVALKELFQKPMLEEQAQIIQQAEKKTFNTIPIAAEQTSYSLSSAQRRLWILSQFEEGNIAYNMPGVYVFEGDLDKPALEQAFTTLIERHEILRTIFKEDAQGQVRQWIQTVANIGFKITYKDVRKEKKQAEKIRKIVQAECIKPFNLATDPLLRAGLYQIANDKWIFTYTMHHIISDGWSMNVLIKELLLFYNAQTKGESNVLSPLRIQYKDYAAWQQEQISGEQLQSHKQYWLEQFTGELPVLEMPTDKPRPAVKTYNGGAIHKTINAQLSKGLKALSQEQGATLFMGLLATVNTLLYRYTNQEDIIIGSPIAGREHADLEDQIGFYINTLALRTQFKGEDSYKELLEKVKQVTLGAYEHQMYPFDELVDELQLNRDMSRSALFDVMIVLQNNETHQAEGSHLGAIEVKEYSEVENQISKFDLMFNFVEVEEALQVSIEYNSDIYNKNSIEGLANHLEQLLTVIVEQPATSINQLDYLSEKERYQLLVEFNNTAAEYPKDKTIVDLFEEQVLETPNNIAVVFEDKELTYKGLNEKSNRLAHYLRINYDVKPDDLVGIKLERSEWMIIAILGILKSGGAYVPIDLEYPKERIDYMIEDSKCKVVIDEQEVEKFKKEQKKYAKSNPTSINKPSNLAYVIYTSGSTGKPKGVMIEHKSVVNLIKSQQMEFQIDESENILQFSNISFDASVEQIFIAITSGSCLSLISKEIILDTDRLEKFICTNKITHIHIVPNVLKTLKIHKYPYLLRVISGGDTCQKELAEKWSKYHNFYNEYGPTETTVTSIEILYDNEIDISPKTLPIGKPIQNTQAYILDYNLQIAPIGVCGELYFGGAGLARGYLNNPELTAERFIPNPFKEGERIYKTGDLGRWLPDGNIEFIGRKDDQVKIRGYRIELGEIEAALQKHKNIDGAVVVAQSNDQGEKELVAYIVSKEALNSTDIRTYLSSTLPAYMLPSYFVQLEELPLTPNGKIDKKALPDSEGLGLSSGVEYVAPRNETEEKLVQIWQEILGKEKISIKDNFFELGGTSINILNLISRMKLTLNINIHFNHIYKNPTIEELSTYIRNKDKIEDSIERPIEMNNDVYQASYEQLRVWSKVMNKEADISDYNILRGFHVKGYDIDSLKKSFQRIMDKYKVLRTSFEKNDSTLIVYTISNIELEELYNTDNSSFEDLFNRKNDIRFTLEKNMPLINFSYYSLKENEFLLFIVVSHIIVDGWSVDLIVNEIFNNNSEDGKRTYFSYESFIKWQMNILQTSSKTKEYLDYWQKYISNFESINKSLIHHQKTKNNEDPNLVDYKVNKKITIALNKIAKHKRVSLNSLIILIISYSYYEITNNKEYITNIVFTGRTIEEFHDTVGLIRNTVLARFNLIDTNNIQNNILHFDDQYKQFIQYQDVPLGYLLESIPQLFPLTDGFSLAVAYENRTRKKDFKNVMPIIGKTKSNVVMRNDMTFHVTILSNNKINFICAFKKEVYDKIIAKEFIKTISNTINLLTNYEFI